MTIVTLTSFKVIKLIIFYALSSLPTLTNVFETKTTGTSKRQRFEFEITPSYIARASYVVEYMILND